MIENDIRPSLVDMFLEVSHKIKDQSVTDLWLLVKSMTEIPLGPGTPASVRKDRQTQNHLVNRARHYLEQK